MTDDAGGGNVLLGSLVDPDVVLAQTHLNTAGMREREKVIEKIEERDCEENG